MEQLFYEKLAGIIAAERLLRDEPLSAHTTFRIGGPADCYIAAENEQELAAVLECCRKEQIPFFLIGRGSNLLVSDMGFQGVVLRMTGALAGVEFSENENRIVAKVGAGRSLGQFAREAAEHGAGGFAFAAGIPGSVGGAVCMNAGAYGGEMKDVLVRVRYMTQDGAIHTKEAAELGLAYRTSIFQRESWYVLEAEFAFERAEKETVFAQIEELARKRMEKQPLEYPSAGSTFKRPEGNFAGKLIMDSGLAGFACGGARVSEKHCGFVINAGNATARDVMNVITGVQKSVKEKYGIMLEPEVRFVGEF